MRYILQTDFVKEYTQKYTAIICDNFFAYNQKITGAQIVNLSPVRQINLFVVANIYSNWQKEAAKIQSPIFDYTAPDVQKVFKELMATLSKNISITRAVFEPILNNAVADTITLLFQPEVYYQNVIEKSGNASLKELHLLSKYIVLHPEFLKKILTFQHITPQTPAEILAANDNLILKNYESIVVELSATLPVMIDELVLNWKDEQNDLFSFDTGEFDLDRIERELGNVYYPQAEPTKQEKVEEKEEKPLFTITNAADGVQFTPSSSQNTSFQTNQPFAQQNDTIRLNEETKLPTEAETYLAYLKVLEQQGTKITPPTHTITNTATGSERIAPPIPGITQPLAPQPIKETPVNLPPQQVGTNQTADHTTPVNQKPVNPTNSFAPKSDKKKEASETVTTFYDTINSGRTQKLKGTIPLHIKLYLIKELFGGKQDEFEKAIDMIDNSKSYHEAIALVRETYLPKYNWNMSAEATMKFIDLVQKRF
jgi:hypothetical protein